MATIIGIISQKGGVLKSSLARALAREAAANGLRVKLADLDTQQRTSTNWHGLRLFRGHEPVFSVETYGTVAQALSVAPQFDLLVLDAPARASAGTLEIFALCKIGTDAEEAETRAYIAEAGFQALKGCIPERPAYRQAQNQGLAITETRYPQLNRRADEVLQDIVDRI